MISLAKNASMPGYVPDYMASSISKIDFQKLAADGIKYIAFDADHTLVPYRGIVLDPQTAQFLASQKNSFKEWCIASNRVTNDLHGIAEALDVHVIRASATVRKPSRKFYQWVIDYFGARPEEIAMIGDKLLADVWGGNRSGLKTVWVEHLGKDGPLDKLIGLRRIERRLLKRYL
jgi:uncharacterized protein